MDAAAIISAVIAQSGTDADRATVLSLLQEQYGNQLYRSRWLRETVTVGTTTSGTSDYSLSDGLFDIFGLKVGSTTYDPASEQELWELQAGNARLVSSSGVWGLTYSSSGGTNVTLYPTPDTSGDTITALVPSTGTALTDSSGSTPVTPSDTHGSLIDGAMALILRRIDERPDLSVPYQQEFERVTEELRRRKNSRGGQAVQALIQGVHWAA